MTYSKSRATKVKVPMSKTAVLTCTSKMPGPSFSLPAHKACPNHNGTICEDCYAGKGCYRYAAVVDAQELRFKWTRDAMRTPEGRMRWVWTMVEAILVADVEYFRGHDSGDFFNVEYVESWIRVCKLLPWVEFWFPTREWQTKSDFNIINPRMNALKRLAALPNVTVRPSALNFGDNAPRIPGLHAGSTVNNPNVHQCVAPLQDGECRDCRFCWTHKDQEVSYNHH